MISTKLQVLLRALRDFNLGKLTADDEGIFLGLLNDLFPKTSEFVPRSIDHAFEVKVSSLPTPRGAYPCPQRALQSSHRRFASVLIEMAENHCLQVKEAARELGYQPTDTFCLKISQLREIFEVRMVCCQNAPMPAWMCASI